MPVPQASNPEAVAAPSGFGPVPTGGSFLDRLQERLGENSNTLFAFAGGALRGGIGKGLEDASRIGVYEDATNYNRKMQKGATLAVYQALLARGVPQAQAIAAASNPEILKAELERLYPKFSPHVVDGTLTAFNPNSGQFSVNGAVPKLEKLGPGDTLQAVTPPIAGRPGSAVNVASGGPEKPPPGYDYIDPNNPKAGLAATPGGPAQKMPADEAGRLAMLSASEPEFQKAKQFYLSDNYKSSPSNAIGIGITQGLGVGEAGRAARAVTLKAEAALRMATGAAATPEEMKRYADFYLPSVTDSKATRVQKLEALDRFSQYASKNMNAGRVPPPEAFMQPTAGGWTDVGGGVRIRQR